ncbi:DUF3231 family protein [Falsibacillus albus]|uniref:DUF3231 family protein n=1 Tax=Falsibacillus albus TaxID=2478915 RepID=A0A3L7K3S9_9BACI|nr:DUF3231 family protein [Falsibacillus albus]RLQ97480.1 DUF3231 family protein [Falsibacillus albus]
MTDKMKVNATELGTLWMTYQEKTLIIQFLEYFITKSDDQEAKEILKSLLRDLNGSIEKIKLILKSEGMAIPVAFDSSDVNLDAPKLYDNGFDIMFIRVLKQISMGMYTLHISMAYREDIVMLYKDLTAITQKIYNQCTQYLLKKNILTPPPNMTVPTSAQFIKSLQYLSGFRLFGPKRSLNTIEMGYMQHAIETNCVGLQLVTGFAQCAEDAHIKKYFVKGKGLSKKIMKEYEEILIDSDVPISTGTRSTVTTSTEPPFSQKMMMYTIYLLNSFGLGSGSFGAIFSMRKDLIAKSALLTKDIYDYAQEGVKIMVKKGWMEEPPHIEDRSQIIK